MELILPATEEEYRASGSKFITFPAGAKVGDVQYRAIEVGTVDWETPGQSIKVPIVVTEPGIDEGKPEKISCGVTKAGIWKTKSIYFNLTGTDMPMKLGADKKKHPVIDPAVLAGKTGIGVWQIMKGHKGGDLTAEEVTYPKLVDILPAGTKVEEKSLF